MKTLASSIEFEARAADALRALLGNFSVIRLREMKLEPRPRGSFAGIQASIEVLGHSHTLACEVHSTGEPDQVRAALREFESAESPAGATPVLIAPYLSPESQALCKEHHTGFLDLEGNARLSVGEFFVGMRALPASAANRPSSAHHRPSARSSAPSNARSHLPKFSPDHAGAALPA